MSIKGLLIRSLSTIDQKGYVTKDQALIKDITSTATHILQSIATDPDIIPSELIRYGAKADEIIDWLSVAPIAGNQFLERCRDLLKNPTVVPSSAIGYIAALGKAHATHLLNIRGLDKVTERNSFAANNGKLYSGIGEVINVVNWTSYKKVSIVDTHGHLVTCLVSSKKNKNNGLTVPKIGSMISLSGSVNRCRLSNPFETGLTRVSIEKL